MTSCCSGKRVTPTPPSLDEEEEEIRGMILADVGPVVDLCHTVIHMVQELHEGKVWDLESFDYVSLGVHCEFAEITLKHVTDLLSDGLLFE